MCEAASHGSCPSRREARPRQCEKEGGERVGRCRAASEWVAASGVRRGVGRRTVSSYSPATSGRSALGDVKALVSSRARRRSGCIGGWRGASRVTCELSRIIGQQPVLFDLETMVHACSTVGCQRSREQHHTSRPNATGWV
jgi:hypothetical protein